MKGEYSYKHNLCPCSDEPVFLVVTYDYFEDESDGGCIVAEIRTVDFMGEARIDPYELPLYMTKSIQQAIESAAAKIAIGNA